MVIFTELADRLGVRTPVMDAIIKITSVVLGRDLRGRGAHTMKTLGLHELSIEQLRSL
jgi:opine dehydrogenase